MAQNCQKQKLPSVKPVQASFRTGLSGQPVQPSVPVVFRVDSSTMIVEPSQLSRSVLVVRTNGHSGQPGLLVHQHAPELVFVVKSTTAVLSQLSKRKDVVPVVLISCGHHGQCVVNSVKADSVPVLAVTLAMHQPKKRLNNVVKHHTTVNGRPGHNVRMHLAKWFFVMVVYVADLALVSVVLLMKFRMLNVIHNAAATIRHGVSGDFALLHVVPDFNSDKSMIVMVNQFNSIVKSVPTSSKFPNGPSGALAQLHAVMV